MTPSETLTRDPLFTDQAADDSVIRRARTRFLASSLVLALLVGVIAFFAVDVVARREARADATSRAAQVAGVVGAWLEAMGSAGRSDEFSVAVRAVAAHVSVDHVVVWRGDGSVVWADDPSLVGQTFRMSAELRDLFVRGGTPLVGRLPQDELESAPAPADLGDSLEIFSPTTGADGEPLVVESYVTRDSLAAHRGDTLQVLLPHILAVVVLLEVTCLFLGWLLVRQVRRGRRQRVRITTGALKAMDDSRRDLAHVLHDGVVQDLAATRYALASISEGLPPGLAQDPRGKLERIQEILHRDLVDLRGLLGELVPDDLESRQLDHALHALVRHLVPSETLCRLTVDCPGLTDDEARIVYRIVREGLVNAVKHADASTILVAVNCEPRAHPDRSAEVTIEVEDDGRGMADSARDRHEGQHFGLALLAALIRDRDGRLTLTDGDGTAGTRLLATFPVRSSVEV